MKILLIDDHALFRDGMLLVLEGLNSDIKIFEASSYESAKESIDSHPDLDLVLLDLNLPGISHLDALLAILQQLPNTPIVVLSGTEDPQMVEQAIRRGARGYIPKSSPAKIMLNALRLVLCGGTYLPPQILQRKAIKLRRSGDAPRHPQHLLTPRQVDVLRELSKGQSNKEIGLSINLTESTVRVHISAILKAFNVRNRTQAIQYAAENGLLKTVASG